MPCLKTAVLSVILAANILAQPKDAAVSGSSPLTQNNPQHNVIHIAGLEDVKNNVSGDLTSSPSALTFSNKSVSTSIPRDQIVNVFTGDQRTEPWGTTGKIARKIIPYGGGAVLAVATNKKVDLLTVEYRDLHDAYHGVVFVLPLQTAEAVRGQILAGLTPSIKQQSANQTPVEQPAPSCAEPLPASVLVAPIQVNGIDLPAEYRILLYEQTIKELSVKRPEDKIFRAGDRTSGPGCAALSLAITVTGFKKGNRALRASTGPLGLFLGTTSLTFDVSLQDAHNKPVFQAEIKKNNRTDSESLGLADTIAKNVVKRFDKATESSAVQMASSR